MSETEEQVRISKILSELGLCSRREADKYIEQGLVLLDDEVISELGTRAYRSQKVELMKKATIIQSSKATVILNKPVGYISHLDDDKEFIPASSLVIPDNFYINTDGGQSPRFNTTGLAPAGRLDIDSSGLLVLTQDGRIAKQIIGENAIIEKEYLVRIDGTLDNSAMDLLNHGLTLEGYKLKPAKVFWQNEAQLSFTLIEGRNRQIRKMCELVGVKVVALKRVRIGNVRLGDIPTKRWRFLDSNENF